MGYPEFEGVPGITGSFPKIARKFLEITGSFRFVFLAFSFVFLYIFGSFALFFYFVFDNQ